MIVRKIKPGIIEIIDIDLTKELESYSLVEVSDKDAYLLLTTSKGFKVGENHKTTIEYKSGDDTDKMFKAIVEKKKGNEDFIDVSKKYSIDDINIPGTSVLIRDVEHKKITVARRTTTNDKKGTINRLFVNNTERDLFFDDARRSDYYKTNKKFAITSEDKNYEKWCNFMNNKYIDIITQIENKKELKRK